MKNAGNRVVLTGQADLSPVPSVVDYTQADRTSTTWVGLLARLSASQQAYVETNYLGSGHGFVSGVVGGYGFVYDKTPVSVVSITPGVFGSVGYLWGDIGQVGTAAGDVYLEAPDGNRYNSGSLIDIQGLTLGGEAQLGLSLRLGKTVTLSANGGYRMIGKVSEWQYRVKTADGRSKSDLPAEGFGSTEPELDISGGYVRVGLRFGGSSSAEHRVIGRRQR